jgi:hypothetical protein
MVEATYRGASSRRPDPIIMSRMKETTRTSSTDTTSDDDDGSSSSSGTDSSKDNRLVLYRPPVLGSEPNRDDLTYHTHMTLMPQPTGLDGFLDLVCGTPNMGDEDQDDAIDDDSTIASMETSLVRVRTIDTVLTSRLESLEARAAKIADLLPQRAVVHAVVQKQSKDEKLGMVLTVPSKAPMMIESITLGSLFGKTKLKPGMWVLSINGTNLDGRALAEVTRPLRESEGECSVTAIHGTAASIYKKSQKTIVGISVRRVKDVVLIDKNEGLFKDTVIGVGQRVYAVNGEIIGNNAVLAIQLIRNAVGKVSIITGPYYPTKEGAIQPQIQMRRQPAGGCKNNKNTSTTTTEDDDPIHSYNNERCYY